MLWIHILIVGFLFAIRLSYAIPYRRRESDQKKYIHLQTRDNVVAPVLQPSMRHTRSPMYKAMICQGFETNYACG